MTLRTGYYLIKSLSSDEGYLGVGANSSDDRRIVVLHPEAMNLKVGLPRLTTKNTANSPFHQWFIKEELSGLYTIKNGNAIANLDDGLTVSVFPSNSKKGDWNIIPRKKYGANVYTSVRRCCSWLALG